MTLPFEPLLYGFKINIHLILEYLAFFLAFRYYKWLRKHTQDTISHNNRLSIIIGAIVGAFIGSRFIGYLENPYPIFSPESIIHLLNSKTIMGGLFGGLISVEISKKIIGEKYSSGDLFTFPIILGIIVGRIGCFFSGTNEFTYGIITSLPLGMNLGDGFLRHPIALYEIFFLIILFVFLKKKQKAIKNHDGLMFKIFMISYFVFRFLIEFIKPNLFFILSLSSIQWLCICCWAYYIILIVKSNKNAYKKVYVL